MRSLFLSDIHLGSQHSKAEKVIDVLTSYKYDNIEYLYLVGDIVDTWRLNRNWHWTPACNQVVRKILGYAKRGTKVYWCLGNHEDVLFDLAGSDFAQVKIGREFCHQTLDNRRLLIIHGDQFDYAVKYSRLLCFLGSCGYEFLLLLNKFFPSKKSISSTIKYSVKGAVNFISSYEKFITEYGLKNGYNGVVTGHIHHFEIKEGDFSYYNCGDWVESCTGLVEDYDGKIQPISF